MMTKKKFHWFPPSTIILCEGWAAWIPDPWFTLELVLRCLESYLESVRVDVLDQWLFQLSFCKVMIKKKYMYQLSVLFLRKYWYNVLFNVSGTEKCQENIFQRKISTVYFKVNLLKGERPNEDHHFNLIRQDRLTFVTCIQGDFKLNYIFNGKISTVFFLK